MARTPAGGSKQVAVTVSRAEKAARLQGEGINAHPLTISAEMHVANQKETWPIPCESLVICVPPSKTDDYPQALAKACVLLLEQAKDWGMSST